MTQPDFLAIARRAGALTDSGFRIDSELVDPVSDNGAIKLQDDVLVLRLVRDRNQWFLEMKSTSDDEWFDARLVLLLIGIAPEWRPPTEEEVLLGFIQQVVQLQAPWRRLFQRDTYQQTKQRINELERSSAKEGLSPT